MKADEILSIFQVYKRFDRKNTDTAVNEKKPPKKLDFVLQVVL